MSGNNNKASQEWFKQADYDLGTAKAMFEAGRYIYTVFMCHLSIEKALKGLYTKSFRKFPPKTHDLNYLCKKIELKLPDKLQRFMDNLNDLGIPTRYPDELEKLLIQYDKTRTEELLKLTEELLLWLREKL